MHTHTPRSWRRIGLVVATLALVGLLTAELVGRPGGSPNVAQAQTQPQTRTSLEELHSVADVVEAVAPSVVNIFTTTEVRPLGGRNPFDNDFFRRFFDGMPEGFGQTQPSTPQHSLGSGVIYGADGLIVTNNHVVQRADEIKVSLQDGREFTAEVVGTDEASDLALLRVDADDLVPVRWGDSVGLRVGDGVLALGNPFGLGETVTQGIVSAKGRSVRMLDYEDFIQTDASINPGNSGGALVNLRGEVVGINTAILSRSGGSQGIGFAIPGYLVERVIGSLRDHGRVVRGYLGIVPQQLTPELARATGVDVNRGVLVSQVLDDSPASQAGLEQGDVIVEMNAEEVVSMPVFRTAIGHMPPGEEVDFELIRDGKRKTLRVALGERPATVAASAGRPAGPGSIDLGGFEVRDVTRRLSERLGLDADAKGPVVTSVEPSSAAMRAGLRPGDIVLEVGRQPVSDAVEVREAMVKAMEEQDGDAPILLLIERQNTTMYLALGPLEG